MFNKKTIVQKLQDKSEDIKNIFTKTIDELAAVNSKITAEIIVTNIRIEALQKDSNDLKVTSATNVKIINKISSFLND